VCEISLGTGLSIGGGHATILSSSANAVDGQLAQDGHWPPDNLTKVMGAGYRYAPNTMPVFLKDIQATLAYGPTAYHYTFVGQADPRVAQALTMNAVGLIGLIDKQRPLR